MESFKQKSNIIFWSLWLGLCIIFVIKVHENIHLFPIGGTSDIYEVNRLAALKVRQLQNPYSFIYSIKSGANIYAIRYVYPPGTALIYSLFVSWCDIRWANCLAVLIISFAFIATTKNKILGFLFSGIFLLNPLVLDMSAGYTASNDILAAGMLVLILLLYRKFQFQVFVLFFLGLTVLIKQFYLPLAIFLLINFWRVDKKRFFIFLSILLVILFPFVFFQPNNFFLRIFGEKEVIGPILTDHFKSPWLEESLSVFYIFLPILGLKKATILTISYLSGCATLFIFFVERIWNKKMTFFNIISVFSLWLLFFLFGLPKFYPRQYIFLLTPGIIVLLDFYINFDFLKKGQKHE